MKRLVRPNTPPADLVLKIAILFGISTDALMRDDWELDLPASHPNPATNADTDETA